VLRRLSCKDTVISLQKIAQLWKPFSTKALQKLHFEPSGAQKSEGKV
jgi:hypothetical protein